MASQPQQETRSFFLSVLKLVIILSSFSCASIAGFYLHPFLLPIVKESMPQLWSVLQGWLTAPFLFILLNVVVGVLYFTSGVIPRGKGQPVVSETDDGNPDGNSDGKRPEVDSTSSKSGKPYVRLVRSKSDQIAPLTRSMEYAATRLKKAGTFESTSHGAAVVEPVVEVADPPENEQPPAGSEGVDKKAEDFIARFYHKMKLQRLESLLRYQRSLQH